MDQTPIITVRRFFNSTFFFIPNLSRNPLVEFKHGLMLEVTFDTTLPVISLKSETGTQRISTGGLTGKNLMYGDTRVFEMPPAATRLCRVQHDYRSRRFFNAETGDEIHSADFALLNQGLITAGWIDRI